MIELLRYRDITKVTYYRDLLENADIRTFIRNENLSTTEGVSIPDFYPALCILSGDDQEQAMALINEDIKDEEMACGEVVCKNCQESSPANFGTCWNCGAELSTQ
jgi:hypothetical protein